MEIGNAVPRKLTQEPIITSVPAIVHVCRQQGEPKTTCGLPFCSMPNTCSQACFDANSEYDVIYNSNSKGYLWTFFWETIKKETKTFTSMKQEGWQHGQLSKF